MNGIMVEFDATGKPCEIRIMAETQEWEKKLNAWADEKAILETESEAEA